MRSDKKTLNSPLPDGSRKKSLKKKRRVLFLIVALTLVLLFVTELVYSNYALTISVYIVHEEKIASPIRVVFLSDLHGRTFGRDNARLLRIIAEQEPDFIALVGDMINQNMDEAEIPVFCNFIRAAAEIAPVYYSMGNHEYSYSQRHNQDFIHRISSAGATVLDNNYLDLDLNGNRIRLGGYMGYYGNPHMMSSDPEQIQLEQKFFQDYVATDRFKLLLNHIPTAWLDWGGIDRNRVDLVFSGHYHGGIIRIPFWNQGLYAPYVGWFPPYTKGVFAGKSATCILTTGLAGVECVPRFFNPPEIVLVEIKPEET